MADFPSSTSRTPHVTQEEPKASLVSNILAIVGFIILIVVVIWGLVHLAGISRTWFSSFFGKNDSAIEVSAPASADSGTPFTVSWKYNEPVKGTYAFLYRCQSGLQFQTPGPTGGTNGIPCGAAFTLASDKKSVSVTPLLSGAASLDVPISIIFMPSASGTQAEGSATVKIIPAEVVAPLPTPLPTPAPAPTPTPKPTPAPAPVVKTPADLSVRISSVTSDGYGNGVATFDITNVGCTSSGTYYFSANLPTQSGYAYTSPAQASLSPGSHVISTLRFSQAVSGVFSVSITTPDANQSNNYASQSLYASYGTYNYNYNQYPQTGGPYYAQPYQYSQTAGYSYQQYPQYYQYPYTQQYQYTQYSPYSTYYPYAY